MVESLTRRQYAQAVALAIAVLSLLWMLFFWRVFTLTVEDRVIFNQQGDFILHFYAPIAYQVERVQAGELPLWNPYNYAGEPSIANIQNGSFYPPRYLAAALADPYTFQVYQLETALHYWLASVTAFLFLLVSFRRPGLALIGAVLYAYRGYMTGYAMLQASTVATEAWFPLALLGVGLSLGRWRVTGALLAGVACALMLLAGRPQAAFYLIAALMAYLTFQVMSQPKRPLAAVIALGWRGTLIGGVGVGLAAAQLLPMLELTGESFRVIDQTYTDKGSGFAFAELIRLVIPGFYGEWSPLYTGLAASLLAVAGLLGGARRDVVFWAGLLIVTLLLSLGANSIVYDFFYAFIPGFDLFRNQERIAALTTLAVVMLALFALDGDLRFGRWFRWLVYGGAGLLALVYGLVSLAVLLGVTLPDASAGTDVLGLLVTVAGLFALWVRFAPQMPSRGLAMSLLLALIVFDLFTVGTRSVNFVPDTPDNRLQLAPEMQPYANIPPDEVLWRVDGAAGLQGRGILFDIPDIYGLGAISLATPERLYNLPVDRLWEVLAVRYITTIDPVRENVPLELLAYERNPSGDTYQILELQDPRPLAHLVYDYRHAEGDAAFARLIMADARVDLREMGVTLNPLPFELPGQRPETSTIDELTIHTPEHLSLTVSTGTDALLTLAMIDYPGWQVTVDGDPVEIVDVYAGLIGVPIRAGDDQRVNVRFVSATVTQGIAVSLGTALLVILLAGWRWMAGRRHTKPPG